MCIIAPLSKIENFLSMPRAGGRRSIALSNQIARDISKNPKLFERVFAAILPLDSTVRMRAADANQKGTCNRPELIQPHKRAVLQHISLIKLDEVRGHVAQLLPRLQLARKQRSRAVSTSSITSKTKSAS
jgi:hypothetical protein